MPFAAEIMMFLPGVVRGTCRLPFCSLLWDESVLLAVAPVASVAEVTASPERKSLRFMRPHFRDEGNAEGYQMQLLATSGCKARNSCDLVRPPSKPSNTPRKIQR